MVVHRVLRWSASEGGTSGEGFQAVTEALLCLGATSPEVWAVHISSLRPLEAAARLGGPPQAVPQAALPRPDLHTVANEPSYAQNLFLVSRKSREVVDASRDVSALLHKFGLGKQRAALHLEGLQYRLGDLTAGVARATHRPSGEYKGLVVDLAYLPLDDVSGAEAVLADAQRALTEAVAARHSGAVALSAASSDGSAAQLPPRQHMALQCVETMSKLLQ